MLSTLLTHGHGRRGRRSVIGTGLLIAGVVATTVLTAASAQAGTVPKPAPGQVVGAESFGGGAVTAHVGLFYQRMTNQTLVAKQGTTTQALGGSLTSGVAAVATNAGEFVDETAYARGTD